MTTRRVGGDALPPDAVLAAFELEPGSIQLIPAGLINRSFLARTRSGQPVVLQRVSEIFGPQLNEDIAAVTAHLKAKGLLTPRLVADRRGSLTVEHASGRWRVLSYIDGISRPALATCEQAEAAGQLVAEFHHALIDVDYRFKNTRLGVHDTAEHMRRLRSALDEHRSHPAHAEVAPLAKAILARYERLPEVPAAPERVVHGDLKISNVLFDKDGATALCLIDLDTVGRMPLAMDLGDAMRSWCNPLGEDDPGAHFALEYFAAALTGYARGARTFITKPEWRGILPATLLITVELAARFAADALNESYFAWDSERYPSASAHNQARARGQLALAASIEQQWSEAAAALETIFSRP